MKKEKIIVAIISMVAILLILPLIFLKTAEPHEFMGITMILFFAINPIATAVINLMFGKHMKKMWWLPVLFSIIFLLSYWVVLEEIIFDLTIYAVIYLFIGFIAMFISNALYSRRKKWGNL